MASAPNSATDAGNSIDVKESHAVNAFDPTVVREDPRSHVTD
jgi:hypothetical protein